MIEAREVRVKRLTPLIFLDLIEARWELGRRGGRRKMVGPLVIDMGRAERGREGFHVTR